MLRLLQSNQPAAWAFVPLTAVLLWGLASMGAGSTGPGEVEWIGFLGILVSARMIHEAHLESRMRTRPTAIPSWVFVLWAVPLLPGSPVRLWWSGFFVLMALRHALRLPEDESGRTAALFWMGVHLGLAGLCWWSSSIWILFLPLACIGLQAFRPAETLSLLLGLALALGALPTLAWLLGLPFSFWGLNGVWTWGDWRPTLGWAIIGAIGWMLRQQSLSRATARQRNARRVTQWVSLMGFILAGMGMTGWSGVVDPSQALLAGGLFCTWSMGWCFPPRWKGTRWIPWCLLLLALTSAGLR